MIYIDPPYNTGNDFIYPDNYSESQTYLEPDGWMPRAQDRHNTDADGRLFRLNMMYPRLYLGRNLLKEDSAIHPCDDKRYTIFVLMNEVFDTTF